MPPGGTHPNVRRAFARHGKWEAIQKYMRELYRPALANSVLVFLHLSKAGGTALCDLARLNGCTRPAAGEDVYSSNCEARAARDDHAWWLGDDSLSRIESTALRGYLSSWSRIPTSFAKHGCAGRWPRVTPRGYRSTDSPVFTAVEGAAPEAARCNGTVELLLLREPVERLESLGRELARHGILPRADGSVGTLVGASAGAACGNFSRMLSVAPALYDNHLMRTLLGPQAYAAPAGSLTHDHFEAASARLHSIDVLLIGGKDDAARQRDLSQRLGWTHTASRLYRSSGRGRSLHAACALLGAERAAAVRQNAWDLRLFKAALTLDALDTQVFAAAARHARAGDGLAASHVAGSTSSAKAANGVVAEVGGRPTNRPLHAGCGWLQAGRQAGRPEGVSERSAVPWPRGTAGQVVTPQLVGCYDLYVGERNVSYLQGHVLQGAMRSGHSSCWQSCRDWSLFGIGSAKAACLCLSLTALTWSTALHPSECRPSACAAAMGSVQQRPDATMTGSTVGASHTGRQQPVSLASWDVARRQGGRQGMPNLITRTRGEARGGGGAPMRVEGDALPCGGAQSVAVFRVLRS